MKIEILKIGICILILFSVIGCVFESSDVTEDEVDNIHVMVFKKDNGLEIWIVFQDVNDESIKIIDNVNVTIIYEINTLNETKVFEDSFKIESGSYEYFANLGDSCNIAIIDYSLFFIENGNYTVIIEYNNIIGIDNESKEHISYYDGYY